MSVKPYLILHFGNTLSWLEKPFYCCNVAKRQTVPTQLDVTDPYKPFTELQKAFNEWIHGWMGLPMDGWNHVSQTDYATFEDLEKR